MLSKSDFLTHYQSIEIRQDHFIIPTPAAVYFGQLANMQKQNYPSSNHASQYSEATGANGEIGGLKALGVSGDTVFSKFTNSLGVGDGGSDFKSADIKTTATKNPIYFSVSKSNRYRSQARSYFLVQLEYHSHFVRGNLLGWIYRADLVSGGYLREVAVNGKTFYRWRFESAKRDGLIHPLSDRAFLK